MVLIHIKKTDTDQFLYETTCATPNDQLIRELVAVWNMRLALVSLADAVEQLAKHGPSKPDAERGLDEVHEGAGAAVAKSEFYAADPMGQRTGNACNPQLAETLAKCAAEARDSVSKKQAAMRQPLQLDVLQEKLDNIRGGVMMAYPMGLPAYDPVRLILENCEDIGPGAQDVLSAEDATLWWAGKEFPRGKTVGDRVGRNEKTTLVARLQAKGGGPPVREPAVSEDERKAMMAHYFKKQEERKELQADDDDSYADATWADPQALKHSLLGTKGVRCGTLR